MVCLPVHCFAQVYSSSRASPSMPYFFRNRPDTILQWTWALSRNILSAAGSAGTESDLL